MAYRVHETFEEHLQNAYPVGALVWNFEVTGQPVRKLTGDQMHWFLPVRCVCGEDRTVSVSHLRSGHTRGCGCVKVEMCAARATTHGFYLHPIFVRLCHVYQSMLRRCVSSPRYAGVSVCSEWVASKIDFMRWALTHGYAPGKVIDRRDNRSGYSPDNCRFTDSCTNANNRKSSVIFVVEGKRTTLPDACRERGLNYAIVLQRVKAYKWPVERALSVPTVDAGAGDFVYLAWHSGYQAFTIGKTSSLLTRRKKLKAAGYRIIAKYAAQTTDSAGFVEVLMQDWLDKHGIERGVAAKSPGTKRSHETFGVREAADNGFKFIKLCGQLEQSIPILMQELLRMANNIP